MVDGLDFRVNGSDFNLILNGRHPNCFFKWKTTSVSYKIMLAKLALDSPELGTAQPQLVYDLFLV